ncbi:LD-carboxypeptidase [Candidatus Marsarchaeota archaeon]|nr:LD-carboxypeptidase [Candidatus Marsarchaeota archaeon]
MLPKKLKPGDGVRVISPAMSLSIISKEVKEIAIDTLKNLELNITFSRNSEEIDEFDSSLIQSRIEDIHEAFKDESVKAILTIGGLNSNQLLKYLDYDLIKANPKIFCGYSDITAIGNAIYAKTKLVTYYGPHFSTFGMSKGLDYTTKYFKKCLCSSKPFAVNPSDSWSDDTWFIDQEKREFIKNDGYLKINSGIAEGRIIGGNLCTLNLLHGTEYMPKLKGSILFLEDDEGSNAQIFDRDLQSLIHQPGFEYVKGIAIGRFQKASDIPESRLIKIIKTKKELNGIPVIANVDCGHTAPRITFPIGGTAKLSAEDGNINLEIIKH